MKQTRTMSLVESLTNVAIGYGVAVITQILVFPLFGLSTTLAENMAIGAIFTVVSIVRGFTLRRLFEAIRMRSVKSETVAPLGRRPLSDQTRRRQSAGSL